MKQDGFTLIELIIILGILAVILIISIPTFTNYVECSKEKVCMINRQMLLMEYELFLATENIKHSNIVFDKFIFEHSHNICPMHGSISPGNYNIKCSIHTKYNNKEDEDDVPYL